MIKALFSALYGRDIVPVCQDFLALCAGSGYRFFKGSVICLVLRFVKELKELFAGINQLSIKKN